MTTIDPFVDLRNAIERLAHAPDENDISHKPSPTPQLDPHRKQRSGIPEIIHAERKSPGEVIQSLAALADTNSRAIASRCPEATIEAIRAHLADAYDVIVHDAARMVIVTQPGAETPQAGGRVGVLSAGSSDTPTATEAAVIAREMGCVVFEARDVGVAGLHRLVEPLGRMTAAGVDVIVVVAGMDGALPSVVAGLVAVPVIGLPTSVGYGAGGEGMAALLAMLQSCAPGLVVVNIDNGVGAGSTAALIANRVAAARGGQAASLAAGEAVLIQE